MDEWVCAIFNHLTGRCKNIPPINLNHLPLNFITEASQEMNLNLKLSIAMVIEIFKHPNEPQFEIHGSALLKCNVSVSKKH